MFLLKTKITFLLLCVCFTVTAGAYDYDPNDFAIRLVSSSGFSGSGFYDDPCSVLGKPSTLMDDLIIFAVMKCSLANPAAFLDPNGKKLIATLNDGAEIVVEFSHRVSDDPCNPYGLDFIVFGNAFYDGDGEVYLDQDTDMEVYSLDSPASTNNEPVLISVAQYESGPWYEYSNGPYGDTAFPTNPFAWDRDANDWGEELDWLKPVDPNLSDANFSGLTVADAVDLYDGSAGGTGFDIAGLEAVDFNDLDTDPNTGQKWIKYIKATSTYEGEIDGFSDVAGCGDYKHPYPRGDINRDCKVNHLDMEIFCSYWLNDIDENSENFAIRSNLDESNTIDFDDWSILADNWKEQTW